MVRNRTRATILSLLLAGIGTGAAVAQQPSTSVLFDEDLLQGTTWVLSMQFADGGIPTAIPEGVTATLLLEDGAASGSAGCNDYATSYELDGRRITFAEGIAVTEAFCDGPGQEVEDRYLSLLPTIVGWSIQDGTLLMSDGTDLPALVFDHGTFRIPVSAYLDITTRLEQQEDALERLTLRVSSLEKASAGEPVTSAPAPPRPRGAVERQFAELGPDPERGRVRWNDRADDETDYEVWARRIQCERTDSGDIVERPSTWVRLARLPANAEVYRPRHDRVTSLIEPQDREVVGRGALYEVSVSARNEAGRSKRVVVGAYFIAPEYGCP